MGGRRHCAGDHGDRVWRTLGHARCAQGHRSGGEWGTVGSGFGRRVDVDRLGCRRHSDGANRRTDRHQVHRDLRLTDGGSRFDFVELGSVVAALYWSRPVHGVGRHWRPQCAVLRLCQPLVRSPTRLCARVNLDAKAVLGWPPNLVFALQMTAIFTCCIPMAMPQTHLVAFCSDLGISAAHGAAMVSVLLGAAFFSRQLWGLVSDRIGGLYTMLAGSACQAAGMIAFLLTQDEVGLFMVSALFGFGFSGLVPANVLASRELFPVEDAYWRMPALLLCSGWGMATGGWLAGLLYDHYGFYAPAFAAGLAINLVNFSVVSLLALRRRHFAFT